MLSTACGSANPQLAGLAISQPQKLLSSQALATTELAQNSSDSSDSEGNSHTENSNPLGTVLFWIGSIAVVAGIVTFYLKGAVVIGEDEVGIVIKKFNLNPFRPNLSANRPIALANQPIALNDEPGIQVDTGKSGRPSDWASSEKEGNQLAIQRQ